MDPEDHDLLFFAFSCASRASEIIKLKVSNFHFGTASWEDAPFVRVKFMNTKTRSETEDDHHLITFYRKDDPSLVDPYKVAQRLVERAKKRKTEYVAHFFPRGESSWESRSYRFYKWFRQVKTEFKRFLSKTDWSDYNVDEWRFHSIRTTYIGLLKKWGMSWTQIQVKTGHKFHSECTRNTYAMNALLTQGFDKSFDKLTEKGGPARNLFTKSAYKATEAKGIEATYAINVLTKPERDERLSKILEQKTEDLDGLSLGEEIPNDPDIKHEVEHSRDYYVDQPPPQLSEAATTILDQDFDPTRVMDQISKAPPCLEDDSDDEFILFPKSKGTRRSRLPTNSISKKLPSPKRIPTPVEDAAVSFKILAPPAPILRTTTEPPRVPRRQANPPKVNFSRSTKAANTSAPRKRKRTTSKRNRKGRKKTRTTEKLAVPATSRAEPLEISPTIPLKPAPARHSDSETPQTLQAHQCTNPGLQDTINHITQGEEVDFDDPSLQPPGFYLSGELYDYIDTPSPTKEDLDEYVPSASDLEDIYD